MIDELKAIEESYANRIKEFKVDAFDLDKEKNILNKTFRDVNLLVKSVNQLRVKRVEAASRIKSNLRDISQLKTFLTDSNELKFSVWFA
jgi:uncharacterized coiled-coil DUF342 family protein